MSKNSHKYLLIYFPYKHDYFVYETYMLTTQMKYFLTIVNFIL